MIFTPPQNIAKRDSHQKHIFLAGSIDMGKAEDWQADMGEYFASFNWGSFNPRRPDWDNTWIQDYTNPQFAQQVNWELDALDAADKILLYLVPETLSPISLLELGLYADSKKLYVVSPQGFWRKGNVEIVCARKDIPLFDTLDDFKHFFKTMIKNNIL